MNSISDKNYIQQVSIDCVIFGYQNRQLKVLVPKLAYKGDFWGLPGGFIHQDEDIDAAAKRILYDRTGITDVFLEQFQVMGKANRSSRTFLDRLVELNADNPLLLFDRELRQKDYDWYTRRFITIGYYALVDISKVIPHKTNLDESIEWYPVKQVPKMIMDYNEMVKEALKTLRLTLDQKLSAFNLLPDTFTMQEVQDLYEAIFNKRFAQNNFPKKILRLNVLERLEKKYTGAANKAPYLYRFNKEHYNQLSSEEALLADY
ncbi:NUDIX hydrolase [Spirosoma endbachense]|uniref:NUDIX domain-containing protein n=1 Tax=Spirosoma endbachense TaxID=2666025 RepID=A0A6P1W8S8_9BACT|nr:NUDIX domain-containing protein [Spirosoma endbachense]QHW00430.1 NUDIX domain-containing protein [Spirosoma endbachense]